MTEPNVLRQGTRPPFVRSAALTYGTNLAVGALSLLNVLFIARALGPTGRGDVTLLVTITILTANLASLGVHQASVNLASVEPRLRPSLATNSLAFSLVLGAVAAGVVAGLVAAFPAVGGDASTALLWLALAAIPVMIMRTYVGFLVQADYAFHIWNASWLIGPVANVVVNGAMALGGVISVGSAVATWVGGQALGVVLTVWYVQHRLAGFGRLDLGLAGRSVRFGLKAHAGNVMLVGNYRLDQWLLGSISGSRELGLYSVAVAWGEALFFLPTALANVLRPDVARDKAAGAAAARAAAVVRAAAVITIPLSIGLVLAAPLLCVTVFGEEFRGSIDDLRWLLPGGFGILALKILGSTLTAQRKPMLETAAIGAAFVVTVVLDVVLIPRFGGAGAAVASSLAYLTGGGVVALIFVRALGGHASDLVPRPAEVLEIGRRAREVVRRTQAARAPVPSRGAIRRGGRRAARLGVYVDAVYRVVDRPEGRRVSSDRAFLLFACEVGRRFDDVVLIGRAIAAEEDAEYTLPPEVRLAPLPYYTNLLRLREVARALPGTLTAMWRGVGQVDVVWVIGPNPFDVLLIACALVRGRRIALGVRQDTPAYYRSRVPSRLWAPAVVAMGLLDRLYRVLARRLPTIIVGEAVAQRYGLGRRTVLPITVSLVPAALVAPGVPDRDWGGVVELLTVGRLEREKNPLLLVEALARLAEREPGRYRLTWVGRGPLEEEIRVAAERLGVSEAIELRGYVPFGEELFALYRRAHVFVHVSLTEGVPQVIIEAMALGTPIVATDVGGVARAVDHGRAAVLVPPSDLDALVSGIRRVVDDGGLRHALVEHGLELARATTLEAESARVAAFLVGSDGADSDPR